MKHNHVIFDCDGVLVDSDRPVNWRGRAYQLICHRLLGASARGVQAPDAGTLRRDEQEHKAVERRQLSLVLDGE